MAQIPVYGYLTSFSSLILITTQRASVKESSPANVILVRPISPNQANQSWCSSRRRPARYSPFKSTRKFFSQVTSSLHWHPQSKVLQALALPMSRHLSTPT